jgi:hypothetical protein
VLGRLDDRMSACGRRLLGVLAAISTIATGLAAPSPTKVALCTTAVSADGTFTCNATIPDDANAGPTGSHNIKTKGVTSGTQVTAFFNLT